MIRKNDRVVLRYYFHTDILYTYRKERNVAITYYFRSSTFIKDANKEDSRQKQRLVKEKWRFALTIST